MLTQWELLGEDEDRKDGAQRWALGAQAASLISFKRVIDAELNRK
jgi:hypothetical protein